MGRKTCWVQPGQQGLSDLQPKTRKIVSSRNVTFIETVDVAMPPAEFNDEDNEENVSSSSSVSTCEGDGENKITFQKKVKLKTTIARTAYC